MLEKNPKLTEVTLPKQASLRDITRGEFQSPLRSRDRDTESAVAVDSSSRLTFESLAANRNDYRPLRVASERAITAKKTITSNDLLAPPLTSSGALSSQASNRAYSASTSANSLTAIFERLSNASPTSIKTL